MHPSKPWKLNGQFDPETGELDIVITDPDTEQIMSDDQIIDIDGYTILLQMKNQVRYMFATQNLGVGIPSDNFMQARFDALKHVLDDILRVHMGTEEGEFAGRVDLVFESAVEELLKGALVQAVEMRKEAERQARVNQLLGGLNGHRPPGL